MAGEWLPYDVCLPQKPEVLELVDRLDLPVDQVVGRLVLLWGWASLNSSDGTARISVRLLCRLCGGDEAFWQAVQDVGWLVIDAENGTVAIPGWDRRFSKSAKNRAMHAIRAGEAKVGAPTGAQKRTRGCAPAHPAVRESALEEREERDERISSSSPGDAAHEDQGSGPAGPPCWEGTRAVWAAAVKRGHGKPWGLSTPPDKLAARLAESGWFEKFVAAVEALPRCRYFRDPVTLPQLVAPGFVDKVLGGQFDNPREQRGRSGPDDRPPPAAWTGEDAEALERTKRMWAEKLKAVEEGAA